MGVDQSPVNGWAARVVPRGLGFAEPAAGRPVRRRPPAGARADGRQSGGGIQVLSSYNDPTYPDGSAGAIYGLYPPMVNPCLPEGQWNSYDIGFEAPRFEDSKLVKPAYVTLFFNGVLVLPGHAGPARFRNIRIRRLRGYDA
jgi:hypothetical protein